MCQDRLGDPVRLEIAQGMGYPIGPSLHVESGSPTLIRTYP